MLTSSRCSTFGRHLTPTPLPNAAPVTDETQRLIEIVSDDILRVSDIQMPINYAADTTSISSLVKTVKLSQTYVLDSNATMRRTSRRSAPDDLHGV